MTTGEGRSHKEDPEKVADRYNSIADRLAATDSPHKMLILEAIAALRQAAQDVVMKGRS